MITHLQLRCCTSTKKHSTKSSHAIKNMFNQFHKLQFNQYQIKKELQLLSNIALGNLSPYASRQLHEHRAAP
jgi:hypothetical protein